MKGSRPGSDGEPIYRRVIGTLLIINTGKTVNLARRHPYPGRGMGTGMARQSLSRKELIKGSRLHRQPRASRLH